jgi:acetoacetyl-CoA synthetase
MPIGFWGDADGKRYHAAYFDHYDGVWWHGDYGEVSLDGRVKIAGRADATLNPGGVRIGTAEIYNSVESLSQVLESMCVGVPHAGDERLVLFVVLESEHELNAECEMLIRNKIRNDTTARHVPHWICAVEALPKTKNGKLTECAVKAALSENEFSLQEQALAMLNPEALKSCIDAFKQKINSQN